jgi:hypothetical protein
MTDMLQTGVSWLLGKLQTSIAQTITYSRGALSVTLLATLGRKLLKVNDGSGNTRVEVTDADFLIEASLLVFEPDDRPLLPERGDRIAVTLNGNDLVFEVLPYGDEPVFRWSDPYETILRVHGKLVTTTPSAT